MGTPDFSVPSLKALLAADYDVVGVFTQPDRRRGRGQRVTFSPVKQVAVGENIDVFQPRSLREPEMIDVLRKLAPDAIVVVAYGQILPKEVLELPRYGCVNVHASLLPRHRGAAPIQAAIAAGDDVTGVTTMYMDEGLDTGDMILRRETPIDEADDAGTLHDRLATLGAQLLVETMAALADETAPRVKQQADLATYAPRLSREDAMIRWSASADDVANHVRAFAPRPGAYTTHRDNMLKVLAATPVARSEAVGPREPGEIIELTREGFVVQTGAGAVLVTKVQPAGRGPMGGHDYSNGFRLEVGETLAAPDASTD